MAQLIDSEMAALILAVTPRRVRQLVTDGQLTNHGDAKRIRLDLAAVADLARTRKTGT